MVHAPKLLIAGICRIVLVLNPLRRFILQKTVWLEKPVDSAGSIPRFWSDGGLRIIPGKLVVRTRQIPIDSSSCSPVLGICFFSRSLDIAKSIVKSEIVNPAHG
jgi:hypothetical protein